MLNLLAVLFGIFLWVVIAIGIGILHRLRQIASLLVELTTYERIREQAAGRSIYPGQR